MQEAWEHTRLGPPGRCPFSPFLFCLGGSPTKIDVLKKLVALFNLSNLEDRSSFRGFRHGFSFGLPWRLSLKRSLSMLVHREREQVCLVFGIHFCEFLASFGLSSGLSTRGFCSVPCVGDTEPRFLSSCSWTGNHIPYGFGPCMDWRGKEVMHKSAKQLKRNPQPLTTRG